MIFALVVGAMLAQASGPALQDLLALDLAPGSIALLIEHGHTEEARARLREALTDSRAEVRAAAARVVHAGQVEELRAEVAAALGKETDLAAGVELALAATSLSRSHDTPEVLAARERLGIGNVLDRFSPVGVEPRPASSGAPGIRVVTAYPPGFAEGAFDATACYPAGAPGIGGAQVTWADGSVPTRISWLQQNVLPECVFATQILLRNALPTPSSPAAQEILLVLLDPEMFACEVEDSDYLGPLLVGGAGVSKPKREREVPAQYPAAAQQAGLRGDVQIEVRVGRSGCVRDLRILRGRAPQLDVAALRAVARWRYAPSVAGGEPVPVLVRARVRFPPRGN